MLKKLITVGLTVFSVLLAQMVSFAGDILSNNTFDNVISPWQVLDTLPAKTEFKIEGGRCSIKVINSGAYEQAWDCQFKHRGLIIREGHTYTVKFTVTADKDCKIYARIGDSKDPYYDDWNLENRSWESQSLTAGIPFKCNETFTATRSAKNCELSFYIGGKDVPDGTTFLFDDIYLEDPLCTQPPSTSVPPYKGIRVNQLGYYSGSDKKATLLSASDTSVAWELLDSSNNKVAEGKTTVYGHDEDSGNNVHIIDFSTFSDEGTEYMLKTGSEESHRFDISRDIYNRLKFDSLKYFYHQRSGIPIEEKYVGDIQWTRPQAHNPDIVSCPENLSSGLNPFYSGQMLDVTGGWYEEGDFGKYTVNGGMAVWTIQNIYERSLLKNKTNYFEDGKMNIPESGNGYPDILDEARYHLECMLDMQIPAGFPGEGMVHHKASDETWQGLAVAPHETQRERYLDMPTTEATLNMAAVAAQGGRLWKDYDMDFANRCVSAAELAWEAAVANPDLKYNYNPSLGGLFLRDDEDNFYWAAAELYVTTGREKYMDYLKQSKWYLNITTCLETDGQENTPSSFNFRNTHSLGTLTLLLVPNGLPKMDLEKAKDNIISAADFYINMQNKQGYGIPFSQCQLDGTGITGYPSESNGYVLNNAIIMAYACDYTKDLKYFNGAVEAMDYIMGRNPNFKSYVTGYGDNPVGNPYHQFFANQINPEYPVAPPGIIVGGPNSGLEDPFVRGAGMKSGETPPQKCYVDHIESWSTNDCSIILNASLAWVSSYIDEEAPKGIIPSPTYGVGLKGDVNDDGKINSIDYAMIKRHILGIIELKGDDFKRADVNNDGKVNSTDYSWLRKYILGLVSEIPQARTD